MRFTIFGRFVVIACLLGFAGCSKPGATPDAATTAQSAASPTGGNATSSEPSSFSSSSSVASAPVPAPAQAPPAPPVVIHAGRTIVVTVDEPVSSKTSNPGDRFDMSLAAPVMVDGRDVIPRGARAQGIVTDAKSAGKFKGNAEITVTLGSIKVHGQEYQVETSSVTEAGKGRGKRTAIGAGGGAVVGGIIGALAGHGKGAAIGAVAGAGAGTAGAAYTGDRDIAIGTETRLNFRLKRPLELAGN